MSENKEKCQSQFPRAWDDIFKCLILSKQSETTKYSTYSHINQKKAANPCIGEARTKEYLTDFAVKIIIFYI